MKKIIVFLALLVIVFAGLAFLTNLQDDDITGSSNDDYRTDYENETDELPPNPYQKTSLHPETIELLDDPNYQNIILPDDLDKKLADGENLIVYFFSPTCPHCRETTPLLREAANETGLKIYQFNLLEFDDGWDRYEIERIPTLIQYKDGKEAGRLVGSKEKETFKKWLTGK